MIKKNKKKAKKKYINIGQVKVAKKFDDEPEDAPDRFYLELGQSRDEDGNVFGNTPDLFPMVCANGMVIEDGTALAMFSIQAKLEKKVEDGELTKKQLRSMSFLKYDVCLAVDPADLETDEEDEKPVKKKVGKQVVAKKKSKQVEEDDEDEDLDDVFSDDDEEDDDEDDEKTNLGF